MFKGNREIILASTESAQKWSVSMFDVVNGNILKTYRGGGIPTEKTLGLLGSDYVLTAEKAKPLLHAWPINSEEEVKNLRLVLPEPATALAVSPDCSFLVAGIGTKLYVWLISAGKLLCVTQRHYQPITCVKFSSDGSVLVAAGQDGLVLAYNIADLVNVQSTFMPQTTVGEIEPLFRRLDHAQPISDLFIGSFGVKARFATVSGDQSCRLYNLLRGDLLLTIIFGEPLTAVVFDAPCWNLFLGTNSGEIRQFKLREPPRSIEHHESDDRKLSLTSHTQRVTCLALNTTGKILASGSDDGALLLWDTMSRQVLRKIEFKGPVWNVVFGVSSESVIDRKFVPKYVLHALERTVNSDDEFAVGVVQSEDADLSDADGDEGEDVNDRTQAEMERLRVVNQQMYDACLRLTEKLYG